MKALVVADKQKILIKDDNPSRLTTVIPTAKIVNYKGVDLVVVPHKLDETKVLRNFGFDIPSPIGTEYHWPIRKGSPFHAQRVTADMLTLNDRMFVLNQIGTGKTLSVLWAYDYLRTIGAVKKMLVVTPLSTMDRVWADEVYSHMPHLDTSVLYGSRDRRAALLSNEADIYIINHDGVEIIAEALAKRPDIDIVVIDELAVFRNASTDRFKALAKVCGSRIRVWGLTGTPTPNGPTDAWSQVRLINPTRVPKYFGKFRDMVERKVTQFKWVPRENALDVVREAMQPAVLFRRDECVDLPPTMYEHRYVEMTAEQKKAYKQMMTTLVADAAQGHIVAVNAAVKAAKLAQVACLGKWTRVLTNNDWKAIIDVLPTDLLWDGKAWVSHGGVVARGVKAVKRRYAVDATPDHKILVAGEWVCWGDMNSLDSWGYAVIPRSKYPSLSTPYGAHKRDVLRMPRRRYGGDVVLENDPEYCASGVSPVYEQEAYPHEAKIVLPELPDDNMVDTYDILSAGPRNRFVVYTNIGPICVHNCGVAYDEQGNNVYFDCAPRIRELRDIIEQSEGKVIVFVPLTGGLEMIAKELSSTWECAVVYGGVGKSERDQIFGSFMQPNGTHVLVAHPKCMSHGLTLVEANTVVWFIPTNNNEDYEQANGRITRPGQRRNTFIIHLEGSEVERRMYKRLQNKGDMQTLLLEMIKEEVG